MVLELHWSQIVFANERPRLGTSSLVHSLDTAGCLFCSYCTLVWGTLVLQGLDSQRFPGPRRVIGWRTLSGHIELSFARRYDNLYYVVHLPCRPRQHERYFMIDTFLRPKMKLILESVVERRKRCSETLNVRESGYIDSWKMSLKVSITQIDPHL